VTLSPKTLLGAIALACALILTLFLMPNFLECPTYGRSLVRRLFHATRAPGPTTQFKWFMGATEAPVDGVVFDDVVYQCEDCVKVESRYATFPSEAEAQSFAERQLSFGNAVNVSTAPPAAARRVVIRYRSTHRYSVLTQCGRRVRLIESASLPHAMEFERRFALVCTPSAH
jgi:hypothetical protein